MHIVQAVVEQVIIIILTKTRLRNEDDLMIYST